MKNAPAERDVDEALRTLNASFRYDPPERWLPAYNLLASARRAIYRARRPAAALHVLTFLALILVLIHALLNLQNRQFLAYSTIFSGVPSVVGFVADFFIARRFPLVRKLAGIEEACKPFHDIAPAQSKASAA